METSYGTALLQTVFALIGICMLAWAVLFAMSRFGLGSGVRLSRSRRLKVLERVSLSRTQSLFLVELDGREILIGASDGASVSVLSNAPTGSSRANFRDALARSADSDHKATPGAHAELDA